MATFYPVSVIPFQIYNPDNGELASGFTIEAYLAGTTTPTNMYTDKNGTVAGTTITLNSGGWPEVSGSIITIFLDTSVEYKFILKDADNNTEWTLDNLSVLIAADEFDSISDLRLGSSTSSLAFIKSYYGSWAGTVAGPTGSAYWHKTGATNSSPTKGTAVSVSTIGGVGDGTSSYTGQRIQSGYMYDSTGAEWRLSYVGGKIDVTTLGCLGNNTLDNGPFIKDCISYARTIYDDSSELTNVTVYFPDQRDAYLHSEGIPIITAVILACETRHSVTLVMNGTEASAYTATYSVGIFTDNLGSATNVDQSQNNGIVNLRFDHQGSLTGSGPDSSVEFEGAIHINNAPTIELFNVRVSCDTSWKDGIYILNSYRFNMYRPYIARGSGFVGGHGLRIASISNAGSIYQPFTFGAWSRGIKIANPDTVTLWEPNCEFAWVNIDINGDNPKIYGGYCEGGQISEIDVGWNSASVCLEWLIDHVWLNGNGGLSLVNSNFRWVASGSGTSEYYLQRASGSLDPQVPKLEVLNENSSPMTEGTIGSLSAGEFDYGDNDGLGYSTVYVRLADSTDPDSKADDWLETGVHGIRLGNCVGGEVKHPHFEGTFTKRFASETGSNGNKGNEIKIQRGNATSPDLTGYGLDSGRNIVKIVSQDVSAHQQYKEWSTDSGEYIETELNQRGAEFCMFYVWVRNNGGTLEARITDGDGSATTYDSCFVSLSDTYVTCNTLVNSGNDFGSSGVGIVSGIQSFLALNVNAQTSGEQGCICGPVVTNNGDQIAAVPRVENRDIGGNDIFRIELQMRNQLSDTAYDIDTTRLASGEYIKIPIIGFIK